MRGPGKKDGPSGPAHLALHVGVYLTQESKGESEKAFPICGQFHSRVNIPKSHAPVNLSIHHFVLFRQKHRKCPQPIEVGGEGGGSFRLGVNRFSNIIPKNARERFGAYRR